MIKYNPIAFQEGAGDYVYSRPMKDLSHFVVQYKERAEEYYGNYCEGWESAVEMYSCPD